MCLPCCENQPLPKPRSPTPGECETASGQLGSASAPSASPRSESASDEPLGSMSAPEAPPPASVSAPEAGAAGGMAGAWMGVAECWGPMPEGVAAQIIEAVRPDRADAFRKDLALAKQAMTGLCSKPSGAKFGQQVRAPIEVRLALGVAFNQYKEENKDASKDGKTRNLAREFVESHLEVAWSNAVKQRLFRASASTRALARRLATRSRRAWHSSARPVAEKCRRHARAALESDPCA